MCTYYRDQQRCSYQVPYLPASMAHIAKLSTDYCIVLSTAQSFSQPAPLGLLMLEMYTNVLFYFLGSLVARCCTCMEHEALLSSVGNICLNGYLSVHEVLSVT